jgi:hypothetical protein
MYSTAWLRLYHHTLSVSRNTPDVENQILDALANSRDTVNCICGLLLLPSPLPVQFNRVLAHIILRLGLHSRDLCLDVIKMVLRNGVSKNFKCEFLNYFLCSILDIIIFRSFFTILASCIIFLFWSIGGKSVDPATTNSVFELLHQLCCSTDQYAIDRVTMMLEWLAEVANVSMKVQYN